jgi:hypothetical protein
MSDLISRDEGDAYFPKFAFGISNEAVKIILEFSGLRAKDKYLWLAMAMLHQYHPDFTKNISFESFAKMLGISKTSLRGAFTKLKEAGLIVDISQSKEDPC